MRQQCRSGVGPETHGVQSVVVRNVAPNRDERAPIVSICTYAQRRLKGSFLERVARAKPNAVVPISVIHRAEEIYFRADFCACLRMKNESFVAKYVKR